MIPVIRQTNPSFSDCDTPGEIEKHFADVYRILRAHNHAIVKIGGKPAKAEAKKNSKVVGLVLMLILFCASVANAGIQWTWDMFNADDMEKWMYDPQFRVPIDMQNGAIIGNSPNNSIYFTENSETIEWVFSTNNVEIKSDTGVLGWDMNDIYLVFNEISAPTGNPSSNQGWLYVKDSGGGTTTLYFEDSAGTVTSCIASGTGNTLDQSYDQGGAGVGKAITVDTGAVALTATDAANNTVLAIAQGDTSTATGMTITHAGTGIALNIHGQSGGTDVNGTDTTWYVSGAGAATFASTATTAGATVGTTLGVTGNTTLNGDVDLGNAVTDTVTITGSIDADVYLDDGSGSPPQLIFKDGSDETAAFNKTLTGALSLTTQSDDGLTILTGNLRVGNGTPGTASMDGEDMYVEGEVEFDSQVTFDAVAVHNEWIDLNEELDIDMDAADETVDITTSATGYTADSSVVTVYASGAGATNNTYLLRLRHATANDAQDHFLVLENNDGDDVLAVNSGGVTTWSMEATGYVRIDADTAANTGTTGVLDLNVQSATNGSIALAIDVQQETGATAAYGVKIDLNDDTGGAEVFDAVNIGNSAGTNATARGIVFANTMDDDIVATIGAAGQFAVVDAKTTANTGTAGVLDYSFQSATDNGVFMDIDAQMGNAGASDVVRVIQIWMDDDDTASAGGEEFIGIDVNSADMTGNANVIAFQVSEADIAFNAEQGSVLIGNGTPTITPGDNDLYVTGTFEVDGAAYFDVGTINLANNLYINTAENGQMEIGDSDTEELIFHFGLSANYVTLGSDTGVDTIDVNTLDTFINLQQLQGKANQYINMDENSQIEFGDSDVEEIIFHFHTSNVLELGSDTGVDTIDFNSIDYLDDIQGFDSGTDARMTWETNSLTKKLVVVPLCYVSATEIRAGSPGFPQLCAGLAGVDELFSTEGYIELGDGADYVRFGIQLPDDWIDTGTQADLLLEFDIHEQAAEDVDLEVRIFEYGNGTPIVTDTILITNGAGRAWCPLVTNATGIGNDADLTVTDILYVEITQEGADNAEDCYIYGARLTYATGIENTD